MKQDLKVDLSVFMGMAQQTGLFSNNTAKTNVNDSFQAVFENSLENSANHRSEVIASGKLKTADTNHQDRAKFEKSRNLNRKPEANTNREENFQSETENSSNTNEIKPAEVSQTDNVQATADKEQDIKTVKMADLIKKLDLSDEQIANLSAILGVSVKELATMEIKLDPNSKNPFTAVLESGDTIDLTELLGATPEGQTISSENIADKLAKLLDLTVDQAETLAKELNIDSIQIENKSADGNNTKDRNPSPFLTGKAAESKVTENDFKNSVNEATTQNAESTADVPEEIKVAFQETVKNAATKAASDGNKGQGIGVTTGQTGTGNQLESSSQIKGAKDAPKTTADKVFNQIVEKAKILSLPSRTEARISLTPANLGAVDIKIVVQDAIVKGTIVVENSAVKKIVDENIQSLKAILAEQGVNLDEISVDINDRQPKFSESGNTDDSYKNKNSLLDGFNNQDSVKAEEDAISDAIEARKATRNSTVYVTA